MAHLAAVRRCAVAGTLVLVAVGSAHAQRLAPRFSTVPEPFAEPAAQPRVAAVAFGHPDDYRWEGVLVGGIGLGLLTTYLFVGFCADPDSGNTNCITAGIVGLLAGTTVGVVTGGLLGGLIPKDKQ